MMCCLFGHVDCQQKVVSKTEYDLMTKLLENYSVYARPISSSTDPVVVSFDIKLGKLVKLDIKEQVMIVNTRITMKWNDPNMIWNASDYNGTQYINIPNTLLWTPDILLQNTAVQDSKGKIDVYKAHVQVRNTGVAVWMSPVTVQASCSLDIKWFPFDQQTCELNFGSISYTKTKLKLKFNKQPKKFSEMKANFHYSSGNWDMVTMTSELTEETYECCMVPFSIIKYTLKWKRLTAYWLLYLVCPCICLSTMSLFTFLIPAESGERTGFGITTVLAMSVYLLVISDKLPEKSDQSPLIGILYVVLFFLMVGVLLSSIITTHLAFKKTRPPGYLRRYFTMQKNANTCSGTTPITIITNRTTSLNDSMKGNKIECVSRKHSFKLDMSALEAEDKDGTKHQEEWQEIAAKIDRILFWVLLAMNIIGPSVVLVIYSA